MLEKVQPDDPAFIGEGTDPVGAVREVMPHALRLYIENAGDFEIPEAAIKSVHDGKVMLASYALDSALLEAIRHRRDREDPDVAGKD